MENIHEIISDFKLLRRNVKNNISNILDNPKVPLVVKADIIRELAASEGAVREEYLNSFLYQEIERVSEEKYIDTLKNLLEHLI